MAPACSGVEWGKGVRNCIIILFFGKGKVIYFHVLVLSIMVQQLSVHKIMALTESLIFAAKCSKRDIIQLWKSDILMLGRRQA